MSNESDTPVSTNDLMHHSAPKKGATPESHEVRDDDRSVAGDVGPHPRVPVVPRHWRALQRMLDVLGAHSTIATTIARIQIAGKVAEVVDHVRSVASAAEYASDRSSVRGGPQCATACA